ncbi:MAG: ferritin [Anaerolineae bacterium]|nr:ferritin [Anaerolineae bacterium]MEB2289302.1 ferritin [Anaerolineae bacterium]
MLSEKMQAALNKQINAELHSAYLYLAMAAYFEHRNLPGFAHWMRLQANEELGHALKFFDFIVERRGRVMLEPVGAVPAEWASSLAVFENALAHEQKVTGLIHGLVNLAVEERDHASDSFLQWFVDEQVEEEASADAVVEQLKLAGDSGVALLILDRELGARQAE